MSELDAQVDSPLPAAITPAMQEAMLRYHTAGGALGAGIANALNPVPAIRDIYHGLTTTEPSETEQDATRGAALSGLLGFIGPMGAGKGTGLAMAALPATKKLAKPLSEAAAESFRAALPKSLPLDHTETIISAIKDALGGDWDHASQMPKAGSNWEPLQPHIDKLLAAKPKPSLSDEAIDAKLAANPGMSLFDLAGVAPKEDKHIPVDTNTLPRGATWQLPEATRAAASEQGYDVLSHHGTRTPVIFDQFRLPDDEIGVHFGSPRAAQEIQGSTLDWSTAPRVYPAAIVAQNPLRLHDTGEWSPRKVSSAMVSTGGLPVDEVSALRPLSGEQKAWTSNLRDYLQSKGYDSIVYKNKVEDKGHDSYILFRESPSSPGYIYGARLPWADFDPSKFTSANIKAGIPLAGATAAYAASRDGKLQEVKDVDHNPFPGDSQ